MRWLVFLVTAWALFGQETPLVRLQREAARLRAIPDEKWEAEADLAKAHLVVRNWLESQLPVRAVSAEDVGGLQASLDNQLKVAGLDPQPSRPTESGLPRGYVEIDVKTIPEIPNLLVVTAGISAGCGFDDVVYAYRYGNAGRARVIEDHPKSIHAYGGTFELSEPDSQGRRLLSTRFTSVQCQSAWMSMAYSVYRIGTSIELLLQEKHGFWLNDGPLFVLKPDELLIEFLDSSVAAAVHNRTYLLRYSFAKQLRRIEPFAFQPQDFVEDWLTRPWEEMRSKSGAGTKPRHLQLHADYVLADYESVHSCSSPDRWLIVLDITHIGEKELSKPLKTFFLVRDLGDYRYTMESVSAARPAGCPGEGPPSDKHPWRSRADLSALK